MSISKDYRTANWEFKKAFELKYGQAIEVASKDILFRYGIITDAKLAKVVTTALRKFLQALELRTNAYVHWHLANENHLDTLEDKFGRAMHSNTFLMIRSRGSGVINQEGFKDLMKIDMGRSKVVMHTIKLIAQHQNDITNTSLKRSKNPSEKLLGSIIRQAVDIYHKVNGNRVKVSFTNTPQKTVTELKRHLSYN